MHERKHGTLKSGGSGKKVTSKKQAIAIGLSEARKEGGKVPAKKGGGEEDGGEEVVDRRDFGEEVDAGRPRRRRPRARRRRSARR